MKKVYASYLMTAIMIGALVGQNVLGSPAVAKDAAKGATKDAAKGASDSGAKGGKSGEKKSLDVKITDLAPVKAGDTAKIAVKTEPGALCKITVKLKSGPSKAKSLNAQRADDKGVATWNWQVGKNTEAGDWPVSVDCSLKGAKGSDSGTIKITK